MNKLDELDKLNTVNAVNHKGYSFMGNPSSNLLAITKTSFIVHPYASDSYIEYDFNGRPLNVYTYEETRNKFEYRSVDKTNVIEIMEYKSTNDYGNRAEFEKLIDYKIPSSNDSEYEVERWLCDSIIITRLCKWTKGDAQVLFIISSTNNNDIISMVHLDKPHYLDGDSGTRLYLLNSRNILVDNDGDCPSVLLIKNNDLSTNATPLKPIPKGLMDTTLSVKSQFVSYKQSIINFIYGIIDNDEFGIYEKKNSIKLYIENKYTRECIMEVHILFNSIEFDSYTDTYVVDVNNISHDDIINLQEFIQTTIKDADDESD